MPPPKPFSTEVCRIIIDNEAEVTSSVAENFDRFTEGDSTSASNFGAEPSPKRDRRSNNDGTKSIELRRFLLILTPFNEAAEAAAEAAAIAVVGDTAAVAVLCDDDDEVLRCASLSRKSCSASRCCRTCSCIAAANA